MSSRPAPADLKAALFAQLRSAAAMTTSERAKVRLYVRHVRIEGEGDERIDHGKVIAFQFSVNVGGHRATVRLVSAGNEYVRPRGARQWAKITQETGLSSQAGARIHFLEYAYAVVLAGVAAPAWARDLYSAADDVRHHLTTAVAGVRVEPWAFEVDVSKVSGEAAALAKLAGTVPSVSTKVALDSSGRVLQFSQDGSDIAGSPPDDVVAVEVAASRHNEPVTISAPAAAITRD